MATIIGGLTTSHVPAIGGAIAKHLEQTPYWKPFFDAFLPVHRWLAAAKPDILVVFYHDHGLNFFLDKMPTFAVGAAKTYQNADEGWGIPVLPSFEGATDLSWHIIEDLVAHEFDVTMCQEFLVDHALTLPLKLMYPDAGDHWPVQIVPVVMNSIQHPLPTAARCWKLGVEVGNAIRSFPSDKKVMVLGTGGLSHQLDGTRAGFINKEFDHLCMEKMVSDPEALTKFSNREIIEKAGSQGVELMAWIAMRGALGGAVREVTSTYHIPISNTAGAVMLLEPEAEPALLAAE